MKNVQQKGKENNESDMLQGSSGKHSIFIHRFQPVWTATAEVHAEICFLNPAGLPI